MLNLCKYLELKNRFRETGYRKRFRVDNFNENVHFQAFKSD